MHPVDEFAALKAEIGRLQDRAAALRRDFLDNGPAARFGLRSERHEVLVREQFRRSLLPDRLPEHILDDPIYWDTSVSRIVTLQRLRPEPSTRTRRLRQGRAGPSWQVELPGLSLGEDEEDVVLIE